MLRRPAAELLMLLQLHDHLWETNEPLTVLGMALGHRMTVARLPDGSLWVHSPVAYDAELAAELDALGPVSHLVAPNCMHDTFVDGWLPKYPGIRFHAPPGFARRHPHLAVTDTLGPGPHPAWAGLLDQHHMRGMPILNEFVFLHRPSRTLIVADLAFNLGPDMPWLSRQLCRLNGCYCRFTPSRMFKSVIRDQATLRRSLDHILDWDFDRIILSHGANLPAGGPDALRKAFGFLG